MPESSNASDVVNSADKATQAFNEVNHGLNVKESFYNPNISVSEKISTIASQMHDIPNGQSKNFDGMEFTKVDDKIFYQLDSNHAIELTDKNFDRIVNWRYEALPKIDTKVFDTVDLTHVKPEDDIINAQKALDVFLSDDKYTHKMEALRNVIGDGEQLSVGSATFARQGNDIYYVIGDNKGIKLTVENIFKFNRLLSSARQEILKNIAESK